MTESPTKQLRDLAYLELQIAKRLRADDLYKQIKLRYSELCADYFDEQYLNPSIELKPEEKK